MYYVTDCGNQSITPGKYHYYVEQKRTIPRLLIQRFASRRTVTDAGKTRSDSPENRSYVQLVDNIFFC